MPNRNANTIPVALVRVRPDRTIAYSNAAFASICQSTPEHLQDQSLDDFSGSSFGDDCRAAIDVVITSRVAQAVEVRWPTEKAVLTNTLTVEPEIDKQGQLTGIIAMATWPADSPHLDEHMHSFFENMPVMAWLRDSAERYLYLNQSYCRIMHLNHDDWRGKHVSEVWPKEIAEQFIANDQKMLQTGRPIEVMEQGETPDGVNRTWLNVKFAYSDTKNNSYFAGVGIDITDRLKMEEERRHLERRLLQAQKLESLGIMAGGVAHDFNNLLTAILGNIGLARVHATHSEQVNEYLDKVEKATLRAAELTQQMLAYSGRGHFVVRELDLNQIISEMNPLLNTVISKRAIIKYNLKSKVPNVRGDASQIRQVVMNLVTNASDAIGEASGVITITTGVLDADEKYLQDLGLAASLIPGDHAYIEVSDTGCGMDEATKLKIFEPFFTTKFSGRGLGLAAVQGIVRGHQGAIKVYTQVGSGTTMKVLLPVMKSESPGLVPPPESPTRHGQGRTILVVDDEEDIRILTRKLLEKSGFNVLLAIDGIEAVNTFRTFTKQIDLVLLDLTMPRKGGGDTFRELRTIRSDVQVILTSGYGKEEATNGFEGKGLYGFLRKPFRAIELLDMVFAAIDPDG